MVNHAHHRLSFRHSCDGKVVLHLHNPECDWDLTSALEFLYATGNSYALGPTPMSRPMPTPVGMSRAMPTAI